jgi:hypothetical protein
MHGEDDPPIRAAPGSSAASLVRSARERVEQALAIYTRQTSYLDFGFDFV